MAMANEQVNPHSNEVRYTLGVMAYQLSLAQPESVRIASHSTEIVKSVMRYLCCDQVSIRVESPEIQAAIVDAFGRRVEVTEPGCAPADAALFPLSLEEGAQPAGEATIVVACRNSLSYKSILHPGATHGTAFGIPTRLRRAYDLRPVAGLYSPQFVLWLALAKIVERWSSAWYFRLEDRAMSRLITSGAMWRLSYIVVAAGPSAG